MITLGIYFVCLGLFVAWPAFAIPSPDFLGPVLGWMMAMIGLASAAFGAVAVWFKRVFERIPTGSRRGALFGGLAVFAVILLLIGGSAWYRYDQAKKRFQREVEEQPALIDAFSTKEQQDDSIVDSSSTTGIVQVTSSAVVDADIGPGNLISTHVPSSTILVPTDVLKDIVATPHWSDRIVVLDIREAEEREVATISATTTFIRYGDLLHGALKQLPKDRDILAVCWTSLRGKEIATWLRQNGFPRAFAIDGGLQGDPERPESGWMNNDLPWSGKPKWSDVFGKKTTMTLSEAKHLFDGGAAIIDLRSPTQFATWHVKNAISLPLRSASTEQVDSVIASVPSGSKLLLYCNEYVNCFYAKVLGIRMGRMGYVFDKPFDDVNADWKASGYPIAN